MEEVEARTYDPVSERMYILGALDALLPSDPSLDDPKGILDDIIDAALIDAWKYGWLSRSAMGRE